ncbi:MAG: preprotein translocase subunit YajC [Lentisphaerae bacterium]|nr:preprotein translocase subunit YajC [Lentisphaerota bacterium]
MSLDHCVLGMMGGPPAEGQGGGLGGMLVPMLIIFAIFYFMLIRPQQRKEKERKAMIESLKSGARVMFSGGILGTVTNVKDQTLVVKVADNVKLEIARSAVNRVLEKDEKAGDEES